MLLVRISTQTIGMLQAQDDFIWQLRKDRYRWPEDLVLPRVGQAERWVRRWVPEVRRRVDHAVEVLRSGVPEYDDY